ncbi:MAG: IS200/IS605 family element transposase accessory protein TnpB [Chloroflexi bacterium]|nr:MAG: IS200/IS605 family element transposase accessory protein TnpB [Chloroflexota bacterium]
MAEDTMLWRTYRYRIYPTVRLRLALEAQLGFACQLYNAALEQRRYEWRGRRRSVTLYQQFRELTAVRAAGLGPANMNCSAMRDPIRRLDRAFAAFFRLRDGRLALPGIGQIKVKWHRSLPTSAVVRLVTVRRVAGRWYACFSLRASISRRILAKKLPPVGLDLGIQYFATLSTGEPIFGPRAYRVAMRKLRLAQRRLSRRQKGSCGRRAARLLLARHFERIRNLRYDHAHKLTRRLVSDFGLIAVEDLNVGGLIRGPLAKDVADQGWAAFLTILEYKAAEAGTRLIRVPPGGTSQTCSGCGVLVPKRLSERIHRCPACGLVIDRDTNAARNILRLGLSRQALTWPTGACVA